jgi:membrane protease YdiL (CAAX protease family)
MPRDPLAILRWPFWNDRERRLRALWRIAGFLGLAAVATILISLATGLRGGGMSQVSAAALFFALRAVVTTTFAAVVAVLFLDRRPVRQLGIVPTVPGWWGDLAFGLFLGAALMTLIFAAEYAAGWVTVEGVRFVRDPSYSFGKVMTGMLFVALCVGYYEELVSRGYLLRAIAQGFSGRYFGARGALVIGTLISSVVFAAGHADNPNANVVSTVNIALAGIMLAVPYVLTGRLATSIGLHITWNFFQSGVYGFPTSGFAAPASVLAIRQGGPPTLTGGAFGPEAGVVGLAAMLLAVAAFVGREKLRTGRVEACEGLVAGPPPAAVSPALPPAAPSIDPEAPASSGGP